MLSTLPHTFVAVVEAGSITKAADNLNLAKSAVSQNLKRLEEHLNVKLATRSTRRLSLTPAGERYYRRCKEILSLANLATTEMEEFGRSPAGVITITAPHALIDSAIAPALSQVIKRFPGLKPMVIADDSRLDMLANGIDIAISVGDLPDSNLKARRIGTLRDVLCISRSLLNEMPSDKSRYWDWLNSLPYIAHAREGDIAKHQLTCVNTQESICLSFESTLKGNTIDSLASFARAGLGIALLPDIAVAEDLKRGSLERLLPGYLSKSIPIYAVHVYDNLPPLSVIETINSIERQLSELQ